MECADLWSSTGCTISDIDKVTLFHNTFRDIGRIIYNEYAGDNWAKDLEHYEETSRRCLMSRHISNHLRSTQLPSGGSKIHLCRLIHKDGTLMWKHALLASNVYVPETQAHEAHIIKTAQRLEELNSWVSQGLDPWNVSTSPWYVPITS